jgi:hypothetical protein
MLADFSFTGYIALNIVKDSTRTAQPMYFLSPRNGVVLRHLLGPNMEGLAEDASLLSLLQMRLSGLAKRQPTVSGNGKMNKRGSPTVV